MAHTGERRGAYRILVGKPKERPRINGKILEWVLKKSVGRAWTGLIWLRVETSGGLL